MSPAVTGPPPDRTDQGLVVAGWWTTILFTPIGIILSIILLSKGTRNKHAGWMLAVGMAWIVFVVVSISIAMGGAATESNYFDASMEAYGECISTAYSEADFARCDKQLP